MSENTKPKQNLSSDFSFNVGDSVRVTLTGWSGSQVHRITERKKNNYGTFCYIVGGALLNESQFVAA